MRHYECECLECGIRRSLAFCEEPFPEIGEEFFFFCASCGKETRQTRVLTKKAAAELRRMQQEEELRASITRKCEELGLHCRFLYQSVIVTTQLSDWSFDYHQSSITLYHESTTKVNFATGDYAKSHVQFSNKRMKPLEVIEYIASHDAWRAQMHL